ncbi:MAG: carboxylating nicotinate-nucleotide diphosphorylase [Desulfobacteraceae bacterium]|nr:carboxylating nicotinate-nucleotide diphosphorylase [Desulfobacteraceae bacterium]MBC2757987.1 carboxylating nicotinate-nucleotide diphosphorylase [Desulfobacteraceae bacterium]
MEPFDSCLKNSGHTDHLIDLAIAEDVGSGDITTNHLPDPLAMGRGEIVAKEFIVVAGLEIAKRTFEKFEPDVNFSTNFKDGDVAQAKDVIAEITGLMRTLLTGERTALNFLQRLSGIATNVRSYVEEMKEEKIRLVDTRKTVPGWRVLDKYAVRVGGAHNHRMGLYDGVLIKDNHIEAFGGIKNAVEHIRNRVSHLIKIEIETSDLNEVNQALGAGADIIMLDNMGLEEIKGAVDLINGQAIVEVSGRVCKGNLQRLAKTGVDIVSVGALIHAAVFVDISMRITPSSS